MNRIALVLFLSLSAVARADFYTDAKAQELAAMRGAQSRDFTAMQNRIGLDDAGDEKPTQPIYPLIVIGPIFAALGWAASAVFYAIESFTCHFDHGVCRTSPWMLVPVLGPFIGMATREIQGDPMGGAAVVGLVQVVGLSMMIAGFVFKIPISKEVGTLEITPAGVNL